MNLRDLYDKALRLGEVHALEFFITSKDVKDDDGNPQRLCGEVLVWEDDLEVCSLPWGTEHVHEPMPKPQRYTLHFGVNPPKGYWMADTRERALQLLRQEIQSLILTEREHEVFVDGDSFSEWGEPLHMNSLDFLHGQVTFVTSFHQTAYSTAMSLMHQLLADAGGPVTLYADCSSNAIHQPFAVTLASDWEDQVGIR
jgi:hypothetical protein